VPLPAPAWRIDRAGDALRFSGVFRTSEGSQILEATQRAAPDSRGLVLDLGAVEALDAGVVSLLLAELGSDARAMTLRNAERFQPLFELCTEGCAWLSHRTRPPGLVEQVGAGALNRVAELNQAVEFLGETTVAAGRLSRHLERAHWSEIPQLIERAGVDALPIVLVLNFLVGFVMAFMSARVLATFGANVYVADLVSIAITRQLGPLMTAIIVCGRSGAAFAAELGSMRVAEEIDALRTLGLEPFGWLVLPRAIALVLVTPVLTLLANVIAIVGGGVVAVLNLGLTTAGYVNEIRASLVAWDIESGLYMSVAFALSIAFIACQQGLAASGGAVGVGKRATQTVVHSLFAIILLDALFALGYRALGRS
jgi:phospholipid/cholesterol/gamma-HCH transport system permease protein